MKALILTALTLGASFSFAIPTYYCESENPKGALYLVLDETSQQSIGRQSKPFTPNLEDLKNPNLDPRQFTRLYVGHVKLERLESGRPFCADCYTMNISPYPLTKNKTVLEATKSKLSRVRGENNGPSYLRLQLFVEVNRYLNLRCERLSL